MQSAWILRFALLLLCASPLVGYTDCWKIETTSGKTITSSDLWQIRSRIAKKSELIGEVGESKTSVNLTDVDEFTVKQSGRRGKFDLHIRLLDERKVTLRSDMDLYYLTEEQNAKKRLIPLVDIFSVNRCIEETSSDSSVISAAVTLAPASASQASASAAELVTLSGDVLIGQLSADEISWKTSYGEVIFRLEDIKLIVLQCGSENMGLLETFTGDRMRGVMVDQTFTVRLSTGQVLSVPASQVKYINRSGTRSGYQEIVAHCNNQQD